jgi:hypothetical protein
MATFGKVGLLFGTESLQLINTVDFSGYQARTVNVALYYLRYTFLCTSQLI